MIQRKISFSSGYCTRHCNVGKKERERKKKKKKKKKKKRIKKKLNQISTKGKEPYEELSLTKEKKN